MLLPEIETYFYFSNWEIHWCVIRSRGCRTSSQNFRLPVWIRTGDLGVKSGGRGLTVHCKRHCWIVVVNNFFSFPSKKSSSSTHDWVPCLWYAISHVSWTTRKYSIGFPLCKSIPVHGSIIDSKIIVLVPISSACYCSRDADSSNNGLKMYAHGKRVPACKHDGYRSWNALRFEYLAEMVFQ